MLYIFESYTLDCDRRELRHGDGIVPVQPQVFDLLEFFIRNRDRVVSRDDMIESVWGGRIVSEIHSHQPDQRGSHCDRRRRRAAASDPDPAAQGHTLRRPRAGIREGRSGARGGYRVSEPRNARRRPEPELFARAPSPDCCVVRAPYRERFGRHGSRGTGRCRRGLAQLRNRNSRPDGRTGRALLRQDCVTPVRLPGGARGRCRAGGTRGAGILRKRRQPSLRARSACPCQGRRCDRSGHRRRPYRRPSQRSGAGRRSSDHGIAAAEGGANSMPF